MPKSSHDVCNITRSSHDSMPLPFHLNSAAAVWQAHVRGHQVRKHYRKIVWTVGIVEKVILRWRRKGTGLRGFKPEGSAASPAMRDQAGKEDDYDFLKEGRKQTEARLEKALERVKSMVQYPEARDQYRRLLAVVEDFQESKVTPCSPSLHIQRARSSAIGPPLCILLHAHSSRR